MKKAIIILVVLAFVAGIGFLYYNNKTITEYYTISTYPQSLYDSKVKVDIKKIKQYESDSLAIEAEERMYNYIQEDWNRRVEEAEKKKETSNVAIYSRFRDEQRSLIRLTHKRSFDTDRLKGIIQKHGFNSYQVDDYLKENEVDFMFYPMLSKY